MDLKYADKAQICRQNELEQYKQQILGILEDSRQLVLDCDNLVKIRALKTRCEKISKPRAGPGYNEQQKQYQKQKYQSVKGEKCKLLKKRRDQIRALSENELGKLRT